MFTGIIKTKGKILSLSPEKLIIQARLEEDFELGESISVDGVCLTVVKKKGKQIEFVLSKVTWERTAFRFKKPGQWVNLELPVKPSSFMGGHIVQGHVDGVGRVVAIKPGGQSTTLSIEIDQELSKYVVERASIAINGVSLTVSAVKNNVINVELIPETLSRTNLSQLRPGDRVNVEIDIIAKYVFSFLKKQ